MSIQIHKTKSYASPTLRDIYKGQIRYTGNSSDYRAVKFKDIPEESLEDYVMTRMSSRYFPDSGDNLMFW